MSTRFFTNRNENTLFSKLEGVFTHNKTINNFDVLVGYFRSSGYFKLRPLLENVAHIRILAGIDVDKIAREMQADGLSLFKGDKKKTTKNWQKKFIEDVHKAPYDKQTEHGIKQFIDDMRTQKVQLKAHPSQSIHAKIYIFRPDDFNSHKAGSVITGSSNLTDAGLGTNASPNYEFNVLLNNYEDIKFATDEFETLWKEGVEILPETAGDSLKKTHLADNITPYELYLKCLIEYFGSEIEFDPNSIKDLPDGFKRLSYQMDAVNEGREMLKKHNGFFLADVVGLGKTVIAVLIARQFYHHNGFPDYRSKILLVIPPALKQNWVETLASFKIDDAFDIFTNGSLHKVTNAQKYDMVIVDEAHKFRNDTTDAYKQLQIICKTKTTKGTNKKVMLVSATPMNNRPDDLYNQILLFQDGNNSTLGFPLAGFFTEVKKEDKEILKTPGTHEASRQKAEKLYETVREKVITPLMVRRTRTDLLGNERYKKDLTDHDIAFPKTTPPKPIFYKLEARLEKLWDNTIQKISNKNKKKSGLLHTRYMALGYLKPEFKQEYTRPDFIAEQLVGIMKTLLLKRMDSSFYAFRETLGRFIKSSEDMLKMIKNDKIIIAQNSNMSDSILADREDELAEREDELMGIIARESLTDLSVTMCRRDDFKAGFIDGIEHDHEILTTLKSDWDEVTTDPKLDKFLAMLPEFLDNKNNPGQKIVLFTESTDTMDYLSEKIEETEYGGKILSVNSKNRNKRKKDIEQNFDANTKDIKSNKYQIILTTNALAEGVNLHRANTVINYDTPWNATKLIQRIGRVNRIGQTASHIFVYNFYPTEQIDDEIALRKKAIIKLQAFHSAFGEDSQIYSTDEQVDTFGIFDENIQEEVNKTIPFLEEARQFKKNNPEAYKRVKELPSKARNAVKNAAHKGGTIVFARTEGKGSSRFYKVKPELENAEAQHGEDKGGVEDYSFIKTANLLKCAPDTKAEELHDQHYPQVLSALDKFKREIEQNIVSQKQNPTVSPAEKTAINFLKPIVNMPDINTSEQEKLKLAIKQIEQKQFQNLAKEISQLAKNIKGKNIKQAVVLENTLNIIKKYNINSHIEERTESQQEPENTTPAIVISQSYT